MKKLNIFILFIAVGTLVTFHQNSFSQIKVTSDVISSGNISGSSALLKVSGTAGEPVTGMGSNSSYIVALGFPDRIEVVTASIPASGGVINNNTNPELAELGLEDLSVVIPDKAVNNPIVLEISLAPDVPSGDKFFLPVSFIVQGYEEGYHFLSPIIISLPYPNTVTNENDLTIMVWNANEEIWIPIEMPETIQVDKENNIVTFQVTHLSIYRIMNSGILYAHIHPVLLDEFIAYGLDEIQIMTNSKIFNGDLGTNYDLMVGTKSEVYGDIINIGNLTLMPKSIIDGNVKVGGNLAQSKQSIITGSIETDVENLPAYGFSVENFESGNEDILVQTKGSKILNPGSYANLDVKTKGTVILSSGTYFFKSFTIGNKSEMHLDLSEGPIILNIVNDLNMFNNSRIIIVSSEGDASDILFNILGENTTKIENDVEFLGTLIAPKSYVCIQNNTVLGGAVYAKKISISNNCSIIFSPFGNPQNTEGLSKNVSVNQDKNDKEDLVSPDEFCLSQNYPNPFNPETVIRYQLPSASNLSLKIYNIIGQEIKTLVDAYQGAGYYSIKWDGTNNQGMKVASGVYIYIMRAGSFVDIKKMILLQ
jgi:hypothetical protein